MKKSRFEVTTTEAFEVGRLLGLKEAFSEMKELSSTDITFFNAYIKARLKSLNNDVINIEQIKRGLK